MDTRDMNVELAAFFEELGKKRGNKYFILVLLIYVVISTLLLALAGFLYYLVLSPDYQRSDEMVLGVTNAASAVASGVLVFWANNFSRLVDRV